MLVISIDPGFGTGIAMYDTLTGEFYSEEAHGFADAATQIEWHLSALNEVQCVAEAYIVTARTAKLTQQTEPLRLLGVAEHECLKRGILFKLQQPSARKPADDRKMKAMGWYKKTKDMHATDAARHLLVYCLKNGLLRIEDRTRLIEAIND